MARGAAAAGALHVVSSNAGTAFDDIGATGGRWWLQAYLPADRAVGASRCSSAAVAGRAPRPWCSPPTPRSPAPSTRPRDRRSGTASTWRWFRVQLRPSYGDVPGSRRPPTSARTTSAGCASVAGVPVVVKGVMRPDDARRCVRGRRGRRVGLQPRRPAARPDRLHAAGAARRRGRGRRRRPRCTSTAGSPAGSTSWPPWRSAPTRSSSAGSRCYALAAGGPRRWPRCWPADRGAGRGDADLAGCPRPARHARDRRPRRPEQASDLHERALWRRPQQPDLVAPGRPLMFSESPGSGGRQGPRTGPPAPGDTSNTHRSSGCPRASGRRPRARASGVRGGGQE